MMDGAGQSWQRVGTDERRQRFTLTGAQQGKEQADQDECTPSSDW